MKSNNIRKNFIADTIIEHDSKKVGIYRIIMEKIQITLGAHL